MKMHTINLFRRGAATLCALTALGAGMPRAAADISGARATELAYQYCQERLGYGKDQLTPHQSVGGKDGWAFSFKVRDADPTTNGLVIVHMDEDGALTQLDAPTPISLYQQYFTAEKRAMRDYRAVHQLQRTWKARLANLTPEDRRAFSHSYCLAFVNHDTGLPGAGDIPYEEAVARSREAILALPGWTREQVDVLRIRMEAYHVPPRHDAPVYQFVYGLASFVGQEEAVWSEEPIHFDGDVWRAREKRAFGEEEPYSVSVRIDARTGDVVGNIIIQYAGRPSVGDPTYFFLLD